MNSFDKIITDTIKANISKRVNSDYRDLKNRFHEFICRYSTQADNTKLINHTAKLLASKEAYDFEMLPELEQILFEQECRKMVGKLLSGGDHIAN